MRYGGIASPVLISAICFVLAITTSPIAFAARQADNEDDISANKFGIDEIYPTNGPEWHLDEENPEGDDLFYHGSLKKLNIEDKGDGVWEVDARTGTPKHGVRLHVDSPEGSWKNVEMTGYVRFVEGANDQFSWLARNGQYHTNGGCDATGYYGILSYDGTVYFLKKTYHYGGGYTDRAAVKQGIVEDLKDGRWIGIKFMAYNVGENNVKLELWLDDSDEGNNWRKVNEYQDNGQWNTQEMHCDRPQNYVVTDATERVTFRVDDTKFQFKDLSVREIDAGSGDSGQIEDEMEDTSSDREEQEEDNDQGESQNQITPETKSEKDADDQPEANEEQEDQNDESSEDSEQDTNRDTEDEEQKDSDEEESNDSVTVPKEDDTGDGVEEEDPEADDESSDTENDDNVTPDRTDDGNEVSEEEQDESEEEEKQDEAADSNDQDDGSSETSSDNSTTSNENGEDNEDNTSAEELTSEEPGDEETEVTDEDTTETEQEDAEVNGEEEVAEEG